MAKKKNEKPTDAEIEIFLGKIGERLRQLRTDGGYTSYEQFAYEHNIGRAQYGKYERGTEDLRISSLYKVVAAFGISMEEFFREGFE
ncbi:helix-turn-helix domain-containing protein [Dinghuibacter silviterrae]|uniref:Helix-turn-helix protein n=1 Tax=Dinghuibacter silviterrae TaxID=1539049 RepID=A0A4R8DJ00_9BACT|nr:helix-turn-helix transcriptional regulator [Dinghuibacter silviterrae]TDW97156.1 helix-turn-helix protein [Dinghuibacter silviterrae]